MKSGGVKYTGRYKKMRTTQLFLPFLSILLLIGLAGVSGCGDQDLKNYTGRSKLPKLAPPPKVPATPQYVPHELLVRYEPAASPEEEKILPIKNVLLKYKGLKDKGDAKSQREFIGRQKRVLKDLGDQLLIESKGDVVKVLNSFPLFGMQHLEISSEKVADDVIIELKKDKRIRYVMRNYKVYPLSHSAPGQLPNDKYWQDHFDSIDPPISKLWGLEKIKMKMAWDDAKIWNSIPTLQEQVVVAVIDSGITLSHPDLPSTIMWENQVEKNGSLGQDEPEDWGDYVDDIHGVNFLPFSTTPAIKCDNPQNSQDISDETGHGTHVSGVIAAAGNNQGSPGDGTGMVGVNGNGQVKIMTLKIWCAGSETRYWTTANIVFLSIQYAYQMGAQVINASWSLPGGVKAGDVDALRAVIQDANDAGVLFVAAAGNDEADHDLPGKEVYPASFHEEDNLIAVAATTMNDELYLTSDFGKNTVHIGAPGDYIYSTDIPDKINGQIGTSGAAPFVSGCAAFLQAQRKVKGLEFLEPKDLKDIILKTADKPSLLKEKVVDGRRLNCFKAYQCAIKSDCGD